ncbi:MAG: pentapeptide repeat-containing protein [Cyanobacteria bacterium J06560_6]
MAPSLTVVADLQGKHISQNELPADCDRRKIGLKQTSRGLLIIATLLFSFFVSFLSGYSGGILGLNSVVASAGQSQGCIALLIVLVTIVAAITQDIVRVMLVATSSFVVTLILSTAVVVTGVFKIDLPIFLVTIFAIFGLTIALSSLGFIGIRLALALADILLLNSRLLKLVIIGVSTIAVVMGCWGVINSVQPDKPIYASIQSPTVQGLVLLVGVLYGVTLTLGAWLSNHLRQTPWAYPSTQRLAVLAVGSWWGTSFENLDLSNISFKDTRLANTDLRAKTLYRTCFQGAVGLERARVDNRYLDLEYPKVQKLLTQKSSADSDFRRFNLRGACLQHADLRNFDFTDTNLTGADLRGTDLRGSILRRTQLADADLQNVDLRRNSLIDANLTEANLEGADLRDCILVRTQVARANFAGADLTGICIEDWSMSAQTCFADVRCDYVYRQYTEDGEPSGRYPVERDFEPGEFTTLFTTTEDIVELVFKGEFDFAALSLSLYKLQSEAPDLNLELVGIEHRDHLWLVKVKSGINEKIVEERLKSSFNTASGSEGVTGAIKDSLYRDYEDTKQRLAESERLVKQLAGLSGAQAEALKELTKKSLGNSFFISGSTITNLAGSGKIEYQEAAEQVRSLVTTPVTKAGDRNPVLQQFFDRLSQQNVAITAETQQELIQEILLTEAEKDPEFRQMLLQQGEDIVRSLPGDGGAIAAAIQQITDQQG